MHAIYQQQPAHTTSQRPSAAAILRFMLTSTLEMQAIARAAKTPSIKCSKDSQRYGRELREKQKGVWRVTSWAYQTLLGQDGRCNLMAQENA